MGASSKFWELDGNLTNHQVLEKFNIQQEQDRYEYGNNPYNGSWSTFSGLRFIIDPFQNEEQAREYILSKSEKWGKALAVKVHQEDRKFWLLGGWAAE